MVEKISMITREPIPHELITEYLMLPEVLPGCRVTCYQFNDIPDLHCIHFRIRNGEMITHFRMSYSWQERDMMRFSKDIFRLRWHEALHQLREAMNAT